MNRTRHIAFLLLVLVATSILGLPDVAAQPESGELVTDRPDETESSFVVGQGIVQIETGASVSVADVDVELNDQNGRTETTEIVIPAALLRYGLLDGLELRLDVEYNRSESTTTLECDGAECDTTTTEGSVSTLGVGSKVEFSVLDQLDQALLVTLSRPLSGPTRELEAEIRLALAGGLSERLDLGVNAGIVVGPEDGVIDRVFYTAALGIGFTEQLGGFFEIVLPDLSDALDRVDLNTGFTYGIGENLQLDLHGGYRLLDEGNGSQVGVGVSWRSGEPD